MTQLNVDTVIPSKSREGFELERMKDTRLGTFSKYKQVFEMIQKCFVMIYSVFF